MERHKIEGVLGPPLGYVFHVFEMNAMEVGTELVQILGEVTSGSNKWLYVFKKDFKQYRETKNHKLVKIVNGKDIISLKLARDIKSRSNKQL